MTSAYQTEHIIREVERMLWLKLPQKLEEVAARWADIDPIPLPMVQSIEYGFRDPSVDRPMSDFPIVALVGAPRNNDQTGASSSRVADATHELYVAWVVVAQEHRIAQLMMWRYGEAVLEVIMRNGGYAGFSPSTKVPRTDEGMATPFFVEADDDRTVGWMAGASAIVPMRGTYVL